ncbi:MAG: hypothetical protein QOD45_1441, partial [Pseudonocardiales bacterium]|nr:hypothetical protein [Pseudonocardiales bacterium]
RTRKWILSAVERAVAVPHPGGVRSLNG